MSWQTLFQSGMGSDAPRTEERYSMRALAARSGFYAVRLAAPLRRPVKTPCLPNLFLERYRDRGNSAKALSHRRVRTTIP
ncbi:MAG: hypothetical protein J7516_09425 [Shinella sp.]|nr:hypothetical protein [Shinella sp.]